MRTNREIMEATKAAVRNPYVWPGGYPLSILHVDGELAHPACVRSNWRDVVGAMLDGFGDWRVLGADVVWEYEGEPPLCPHCNQPIETAYGRVNA